MTSWPDTRTRAIASLALTVTAEPWSLGRADLAALHRASLSDEDILHVIELSSYFGHLNRVADVTGVPLDYEVKLAVPKPDTVVQAWPSATRLLSGRPAIDPARQAIWNRARTELREIAGQRAARGERRWASTLFPTSAFAQDW